MTVTARPAILTRSPSRRRWRTPPRAEAWKAVEDYLGHPAQIRELLVRQLTSPVRWSQSMQKLIADGVTGFYEIGPGRVLGGLMKRIDRKASVTSVNSLDAVKALGE